MPSPIKPGPMLRLEKGKLYGEQRERVANEPQGKRKILPKCPKKLTKEQRKEWNYYAKILDNYGLFDVANATHLELLAVNMAAYRDLLDKVQKTGVVIMSTNQIPIYNPYFSAMNAVENKILKILSDLGLSSSGLAKLGSLSVKARKEKDEMEDYLD